MRGKEYGKVTYKDLYTKLQEAHTVINNISADYLFEDDIHYELAEAELSMRVVLNRLEEYITNHPNHVAKQQYTLSNYMHALISVL